MKFLTIYDKQGKPLGICTYKQDAHALLNQAGVYDRELDQFTIDRQFELKGFNFKMFIYPGFIVKVGE